MIKKTKITILAVVAAVFLMVVLVSGSIQSSHQTSSVLGTSTQSVQVQTAGIQNSENKLAQVPPPPPIAPPAPAPTQQSPTSASTQPVKHAFYVEMVTGVLSDIQYSLVYPDGSKSPIKQLDAMDGVSDTDTVPNTKVSNLVYDPQGFVSIEWTNPNNDQFKVTDMDSQTQAQSQPQVATDFTVPVQFESEYTKKLFAEMGLNIITREEWGAPSYSLWTPEMNSINRFVIHHTAFTVDMSNPASSVMLIYNFHKIRCSNNIGTYPNDCAIEDTWQDIGYNYLIDPNGTIYQGRTGGNGVIGAHAIPNSGSIGIAMMGDFTNSTPTTAAFISLEKLMAVLSLLNHIDVTSGTSLKGHKDYQNTECPGQVYGLLPRIATDTMSMRSSMTNLINIRDKVDAQMTGNSYTNSNGLTDVFIDTSNSTANIVSKFHTNSWGVSNFQDIAPNKIKYEIDPSLVKQFLTELDMGVPEAGATLNFKISF